MLAEKNEYIAETTATVYKLTQDERVRMECEVREDFYRTQLGIKRRLERLESEKEKLVSENKKLASENKKLASENKKLASEIETLKSRNAELESEIEQLLAWAKKNGYHMHQD